MQQPADKLMLLGLCLLLISFSQIELIIIIALLAAVASSSLCEYFQNRINPCLCAAYITACFFIPEFLFLLPLIVYDCAGLKGWYFRFLWTAALPFCFIAFDLKLTAAVVLLSGSAFLLQYRTSRQIKILEDYFTLIDNAKEQSLNLERRNREMMENQDYEVRLATLKERNRISREIHDNVGHLLTRGILQISALGVAKPDESGMRVELLNIKDTMSDAMYSIRKSVHDLYDDSMDLKLQLESLVSGFNFCRVTLRYDADDLPGVIKYCLISVAREALSNIARHSNATDAAITVTEHPAFCRLYIKDNGTQRAGETSQGIGLLNMADRVEALGGVFRAGYNNGFAINVSVPKERTHHD